MPRTVGVAAVLCLYVAIGIHRQAVILEQKPLPRFLMEDYDCYGRALARWRAGQSPYADRAVGTTAYLYPPQALLLVGGLEIFKSLPVKFSVYVILNLLALVGILAFVLGEVSGTPEARAAKERVALALALGFAPVGTSLALGQVNVLVAFTLAAGFFWAERRPRLAGAAIAVGAAIKLTPVFLLVLFLRRRYLTLWLSFVVTSLVLACVSLAVFGVQSFRDFAEIAGMMKSSFIVGFNGSLSLVNTLSLLAGTLRLPVKGWYQQVQSLISLALLALTLASAYLTRDGRRRDLFFALVTLAITAMPNVLWYHHFAFTLPALLTLWLSPESTPLLRGAGLAALGIIQLDQILSPKLDKLTTTPVAVALIGLVFATLVRARREAATVGVELGAVPPPSPIG